MGGVGSLVVCDCGARQEVGPILEHELAFCEDYPADKPRPASSALGLDRRPREPRSIAPTSRCTKTFTGTFFSDAYLKSKRSNPTNLNFQQLMREFLTGAVEPITGRFASAFSGEGVLPNGVKYPAAFCREATCREPRGILLAAKGNLP